MRLLTCQGHTTLNYDLCLLVHDFGHCSFSPEIQSTLDLVTLNLVKNLDLVNNSGTTKFLFMK